MRACVHVCVRVRTAEREDLLDVALVRQVARRLLEHEVVQREVLALGPHERELVEHARLLVLETVKGVEGDGLPALHLDRHLRSRASVHERMCKLVQVFTGTGGSVSCDGGGGTPYLRRCHRGRACPRRRRRRRKGRARTTTRC